MKSASLTLASGSPRRAEILDRLGLHFDRCVADADETPAEDETPLAYVCRVARLKADTVLPDVAALPVLAADTIVVIDDDILGKPADAREARRMLGRLSGRHHTVLTSVVVRDHMHIFQDTSYTRVRFRPLDAALIDRYVASGEPMDKAGAYGIQGLGEMLVEGIEGSHSGVVGLPVAETLALLARFGIEVPGGAVCE